MLETAIFEPGEPLPKWRDLGSWLKDRDQELTRPIEVEPHVKLGFWASKTLKPGDPLPHRDELRKLTEMKRDEIEEAIEQLKLEGRLVKTVGAHGGVGRWVWSA